MFDILNTIKELPDSARHDLYNYAEYLHKKYHKEKKSKSFKLDWVGDLSELNIKYSSVELQHEITNMWLK